MSRQFLASVAAYIGLTQQHIAKIEQTMQKQAKLSPSRKEVEDAVDVLIKYGSVAASEKEAVVDTFLHNSAAVLNMLVKTCSKLKPVSMGVPSNRSALSTIDPIARFCLET